MALITLKNSKHNNYIKINYILIKINEYFKEFKTCVKESTHRKPFPIDF